MELIVRLVALSVIVFLLIKAKSPTRKFIGYICFLGFIWVAYDVVPHSAFIVYVVALVLIYVTRFATRDQGQPSKTLKVFRRVPAPVTAVILYWIIVACVPYGYGIVWERNGERDQIKQNLITGQTFRYVTVNQEWVDASPPCGHLNTPPDFPPREPGTIRWWTIKVHECGDYVVEWGANPAPSYLPHTTLPTPQSRPAAQTPTPATTLGQAFVPSDLITEDKFGDYTIRIYRNGGQVGMEGLEILKQGSRVYADQNYSFWFGNDEDDQDIVPVGTDITGLGVPDLVVKEYSGGAHCCTSFEIFELGTQFSKLATIKSEDCGGVVRRQGDGVYVFSVCDEAVRMYGSGFSDSAAPKVILRYVNGSFHLAPDLMRKRPPSVEELKGKAAEIASNPTWSTQDIPGAFWQYVIDLTYSGNSRSADQFIALAWPLQRSDKDQRIQEFLAQLKKSPYWGDIQALNAK
jgi:hypothetical protein